MGWGKSTTVKVVDDAIPTATSTSDPTPDPSFESPPRVSRGIFSSSHAHQPPPDPPDPTARSHSTSLVDNKAKESRSSQYHDEYDDDSIKERDTSKCIFKSFFTILIIGMAGYLTWKFGLDSPTSWSETKDAAQDMIQNVGDKLAEWDLANFTDVLDGLDDINFGDLFGGDPMLGDNVTIPWENDFVDPSNGGLQLTIQNALDDTWQSEFELAISDWQESDALVLTTERVAVDYNCNPIDGVMVVCNANFGATGWVGINENSIMRNTIVGSVAKMNEYYLRNADFNHRRFTMCHEIGHGFGLPHTDENPHNENLGNCLDYTDSPTSNMLPGEVNMAKLRDLYLTQRRRRVEADGTVVITRYTYLR